MNSVNVRMLLAPAIFLYCFHFSAANGPRGGGAIRALIREVKGEHAELNSVKSLVQDVVQGGADRGEKSAQRELAMVVAMLAKSQAEVAEVAARLAKSQGELAKSQAKVDAMLRENAMLHAWCGRSHWRLRAVVEVESR